jgi:nitroreductase
VFYLVPDNGWVIPRSPKKIFLTSSRINLTSGYDTGLAHVASDFAVFCSATENILLAARAHGLGSCWVAGDKKPYAAEICGLVGEPPSYKLVSLIPIGHPAESPEKAKRPLSDVLHWEKY